MVLSTFRAGINHLSGGNSNKRRPPPIRKVNNNRVFRRFTWCPLMAESCSLNGLIECSLLEGDNKVLGKGEYLNV